MPIDFYNKLNKAKDVYTFRDFILLPGLSKIEPEDVLLTSNFSTDIKLNVPLVSSPMDTVTESEMAISMAREGGLGIIHRNMSIDKQVEEVKKVKRAESFIIKNLVTASPDLLISEATKIMSKHNVSGLPITGSDFTFRRERYQKNKPLSTIPPIQMAPIIRVIRISFPMLSPATTAITVGKSIPKAL